ncbi:hypothetical protein [Candidatus Nitrospira allomarina]|uniref:Uncharacterized protein n=1 Tax=Candidatus Nitrospira allomarina TaxID=3020900 RepID=A0AA96JUE1_9BACT|nr:hypothetical protein [Candidatus Nitrospira allomarina]WNM60030.1 hypothetical protein PP769_09815 [Candidatus Nitrospira allomarina]
MDHAQREQSLLKVLEAFTKGLTSLKEAIALVHSANDQLLPGEARKSIQKKIEEAERMIQVGHAAMGQSLGFQLCHCTWPPQVMASSHYSNETKVEQFTCPNCGKRLSLSGRQAPRTAMTAFDPYDVY